MGRSHPSAIDTRFHELQLSCMVYHNRIVPPQQALVVMRGDLLVPLPVGIPWVVSLLLVFQGLYCSSQPPPPPTLSLWYQARDL